MIHVPVRRVQVKQTLFVLAGILLISAIIFGYVSQSHQAKAEGETITGSTSFYGFNGRAVAVDDLEITTEEEGDPTVSVKLYVEDGYLHLNPVGSATIDPSSTNSIKYINGPLSDVNTTLATLTYTNTDEGEYTIEVSLVGAGEVYFPDNGHIYQVVHSDPGVNWVTAEGLAASMEKDGMTGYLATMTSAEENDFIAARLTEPGWMGASDTALEDDWRWVTGPETGLAFWYGNVDGSTVDGQYAHWQVGAEPNNYNGDEGCGQFLAGAEEVNAGYWNDLPCEGQLLPGYVVEFGDDETGADVASKNIDIDIQPRDEVTFSDGDGVDVPYGITDCEQLQAMNQGLDKSYVLKNNIDCTETVSWNEYKGFDPINSIGGDPFTGRLDGAGFAIDGLFINRANDIQDGGASLDDETFVGLFGYTMGAYIHDLSLTNAMIKGYFWVGGIIGDMQQGTLRNVRVNVGVEDNSCAPGYCVWARYGVGAGGLVGRLTEGEIYDSRVGGPVKGSGVIIGGLVGEMNSGLIKNSFANSNIDGGYQIGGAVGIMYGGTLEYVHATGNVDVNEDEAYKQGIQGGGLIGQMLGGIVKKSYATGNVHGDRAEVGGLVGRIEGTSTLEDVYAWGDVDAKYGSAGGLVGIVDAASISRAYAKGSVSAEEDEGYALGGLVGYINPYLDPVIIRDVFSVGHVMSEDISSSAALIGSLEPDPDDYVTNAYYDFALSGDLSCVARYDEPVEDVTNCTAVNIDGDEPAYFFDYRNAPFKQDGTQIWNRSVWRFDGEQYPTLMAYASDADDDGYSDESEDGGPNSGDANHDGDLDSTQDNVLSFANPEGDGYIVLELDPTCATEGYTWVSNEEENAVPDEHYSYVAGLLNFVMNCGEAQPGYTTPVTIYFYGVDADNLVVRKYNTVTEQYASVPEAVVTPGAGYVKVSYDITDGGALDQDGEVNGEISDPIGLAQGDGSQQPQSQAPGAPNTGVLLAAGNLSPLLIAGLAGAIVFGVRRAIRVTSRK